MPLAAIFLLACSNPCEDLAEHTCALTGEGSPECVDITQKAERASQQDREACEAVLGVVDELAKAR